MKYNEYPLTVNEAAHRLELTVDRSTAFIEYKLSGKNLFLVHTEVPAELEGKGVGSAIVEKALLYARENGYKVVPLCVFVQSYLKRHREWEDIVSSEAERFINRH